MPQSLASWPRCTDPAGPRPVVAAFPAVIAACAAGWDVTLAEVCGGPAPGRGPRPGGGQPCGGDRVGAADRAPGQGPRRVPARRPHGPRARTRPPPGARCHRRIAGGREDQESFITYPRPSRPTRAMKLVTGEAFSGVTGEWDYEG